MAVNIGAPLTEFVIETVIRDGLGEIRSDPDLLDDVFGRFKETHFGTQYGQSKIDEIKTYFTDNQIRIIQALSMAPTIMPSISIQLVASSEEEADQQFGNDFEEVSTSITPDVIAAPITPGTYDTVTGKLTITNSVDLSLVCPGHIFVDASATEFTIGVGNSNESGNKFINIGTGKDPDLSSGARIDSRVDEERTARRMIRTREVIRIGCHSKDDLHLTKYIYYVLIFILKSRQDSLETRGIHLDREEGEMFDRDYSFEGENVFSRYVDIHCLTEFNWDQEKVQLFDCFNLTIKAPDPDPDSEDTITVSPSDE